MIKLAGMPAGIGSCAQQNQTLSLPKCILAFREIISVPMPRLQDGVALTETTFIEEWTKLSGVSSLLACADDAGIRIGVWGGLVRNFVLDDRPLTIDWQALDEQALHLIDFVDPYSDIDCVLDRADDWYLIAQSISSSFAFAGYHRWEVQALDRVTSSLTNYARIAAESFIVWHEGFDDDRRPKISLQSLEGNISALLKNPAGRVGLRTQAEGIDRQDPWQNIFDSLRLSRFFLQYENEANQDQHLVFPDNQMMKEFKESSPTEDSKSKNWLRFDLAVLDILMTATSLRSAAKYLLDLYRLLPTAIREGSTILMRFQARYQPEMSFIGGIVYRQRDSQKIRLRLLTDMGGNLSQGGFGSIVPWTRIWSLGPGEDNCCRHEDFRNGVAVVSWRPVNSDTSFSQKQAFDLAPVAQIAQDEPYDKHTPKVVNRSRKTFSLPGVVRIGPSLTLRFDHAYMAQFLGHNVQTLIGLVDPKDMQ
jgi:hypothetical protein